MRCRNTYKFRRRIISNLPSSHTHCFFLVHLIFRPLRGISQLRCLRVLRRTRCIGCGTLHSQTAIQIGRQQCAHPAHVFIATLHTFLPAPERDDCNQPSFMTCNHHKASSKTGHFSERPMDRRWQSGVHLVRLIGLCDKLYGQSGGPRAGVAYSGSSRSRRIRIERLRYRIGKEGVLLGT